MNKVILMGRFTTDGETRYTQSNVACYSNSIAVDRKFAQGDVKTDFFYISAFSKTAEFIAKYFKKGSKILITGRIENDTYTNKDGQKVTTTKVIAEEVDFCEKANNSSDNQQSGNISIPNGIDDELPFK